MSKQELDRILKLSPEDFEKERIAFYNRIKPCKPKNKNRFISIESINLTDKNLLREIISHSLQKSLGEEFDRWFSWISKKNDIQKEQPLTSLIKSFEKWK